MRIFISYKDDRDNGGKVDQIVGYVTKKFDDAFKNRPICIFRDEKNLHDGDNWYKEIWKALFKSDCFVIIADEKWISEMATHKGSFSYVEAVYAAAHYAGNNVYIIPVKGQDFKVNAPGETGILDIRDQTISESIRKFPIGLNNIMDRLHTRTGATLDSYLEGVIGSIKKELHRIKQLHPSPILFISSVIADSSSNSHLEYFGSIIRLLADEFAKHKDWSIDCVIKITPTTFDQTLLIADAISRDDYYRGIIIAPYETEESGRLIHEYLDVNDRNSCPIFTIDKTYHKLSLFNGNVKAPCGVMSDWEQGGKEAATLFDHYCKRLNINSPRILLVDGLEGGKERLESFYRTLVPVYENSMLCWLINGDFSRNKACDKFFGDILTKVKPGYIHGVFCANDEMALGVRDAIKYWEEDHEDEKLGIVIIGYDGIETVKKYIDQGDPYLLNTIDVNLRNQVRQLTHCVMQTLRGDKFKENNGLHKISGTPHLSYKLQNDHIESIKKRFGEELIEALKASKEPIQSLNPYLYHL